MSEPGAPSRWWIWLLVGAVLIGAGLMYRQSSETPPPTVFRWGGDASGGEPFLIERPGKQPAGFEGELAVYLGEKLGLPPEFVQRNWAQMPQDLTRGDIDAILNGYEWYPSREEVMASTIPYYAYRISLITRKNSPIQGWEDLRGGLGRRKLRVGVLRDSSSHRYLEEHYPDEVALEAYDEEGVTGVMLKVAEGGLDATVQDTPAARWYLRQKEFDRLHEVGEPIKPARHSYYVLYVRRGDEGLRDRLNEAIREGLKDGSLRRIYEKYDLWNDDQAGLLEVGQTWPPAEVAIRRSMGWYARQLGQAALMTIALAALSFPMAMVLGLALAVGRLYGPRWLAYPLAWYVELIRGTPLLLQLSVIFYFLPVIHITLNPFWAGALGLALNYAAYEAEIYRAGLLAIPRGQMEAALSLGMRPAVALGRILVPQAVRMVVPPVTNDFIALFKDTSICAVFAVTELTARYRSLAVNNPGLLLELGLMTALLYLLMSYPLSLLARSLERQHQHVEG
ncbi:MAG: ABC transporter permease subunit [Gemmataceae bacterium]